ncbi:hypothetical protein PR202_gb25344 [Eleusine coracana subsp. coracana]|uniref:Uncharacterized protein n=1 Tax=Eleusine coracana subsp. coracana TaxID=191504 RepID=A0AAV5FNP5_ELECO|nr:hypothetical protein PR202_gb25299 [Eleusine coracana subsp. coracana]GJN36483.1 hypothetical protein PR202_gb25344 [Eleusine coracana subsp. coracana]
MEGNVSGMSQGPAAVTVRATDPAGAGASARTPTPPALSPLRARPPAGALASARTPSRRRSRLRAHARALRSSLPVPPPPSSSGRRRARRERRRHLPHPSERRCPLTQPSAAAPSRSQAPPPPLLRIRHPPPWRGSDPGRAGSWAAVVRPRGSGRTGGNQLGPRLHHPFFSLALDLTREATTRGGGDQRWRRSDPSSSRAHAPFLLLPRQQRASLGSLTSVTTASLLLLHPNSVPQVPLFRARNDRGGPTARGSASTLSR